LSLSQTPSLTISFSSGTYRAKGSDVKPAVRHALLECGIRHIDTASIYKNEGEIAEAIREAGVERSTLFLTSKISPYEQGTDRAAAALDAILSRLGTDYLDLCLIHW
jgi:diketogulonate reductase-like aldo/keto reductase